ncbi:hypothetical protein LCI18_001953 [Fusarium solani-melongenae]|uniref:Uncharacterized protein n=1 Tax=Fusarium solani subsp. cucurbitae TaxID=2747967 RepID=A0ACD3YQ78_FUSSC|nr:hypothetical protein LCI18_001953 [Fusarium solani-melongenae]
MFLWEIGNKTSAGVRVPRSKLPAQPPKAIRFILRVWSKTLANPEALSSSCKVLQDCRGPLPSFAPPTQIVHPVCLLAASNGSPKDKLESLEAWAVSTRDRNQTFDAAIKLAKSIIPNLEARYFWPNQTKYPSVFDQIMWLARFKDTMEIILETSRLIADELPEEIVLVRFRLWYQGKEGRSKVKKRMDDLEQLLQVDMRRQLYDLIVGLEAVGDICHQHEDETGVLLRKLLHPQEQCEELRVLSREIVRRERKL